MNKPLDPIISKVLSLREIRRYQLQISSPGIGLAGQEKIKQSKVLVIGAGGKGTAILQNLTSIGIGTIGICDNYTVQEEELSRQHLFGSSDLGKLKAIVAKQKLIEINHLVNFELHNVYLSENNIDLICKDYDMLIDATDNFSARYLINDAAVRLNKPWIVGMISDSVGRISIFNYMNGPSFRCLYPAEPRREEIYPPGNVACQISLLSIIGAIISNETIKVILQLDSELSGKLLKFNSSNYSISFEDIVKNPANFAR